MEEEGRIWIIPAALGTIVSLGSAFYIVYLHQIGAITSDYLYVIYGFVYAFPISIAICFGTYEILASIDDTKPVRFHLKRFLFRISVMLGYAISIIAFFSLLLLLLPWNYALLLAAFSTTLVLAVLVFNPAVRRMIRKFDGTE